MAKKKQHKTKEKSSQPRKHGIFHLLRKLYEQQGGIPYGTASTFPRGSHAVSAVPGGRSGRRSTGGGRWR